MIFKEACTALAKSRSTAATTASTIRPFTANSPRDFGGHRRAELDNHTTIGKNKNVVTAKGSEQTARKSRITQQTCELAKKTLQKGRMVSVELLKKQLPGNMKTEYPSDTVTERLPRFVSVWPHLW